MRRTKGHGGYGTALRLVGQWLELKVTGRLWQHDGDGDGDHSGKRGECVMMIIV
jgi:hypothetical protein